MRSWGGALRWFARRFNAPPRCAGCERGRPEVGLVSGPQVYICADCAAAALERIRAPAGTHTHEGFCSFCRIHRFVVALDGEHRRAICEACAGTALEVFAESQNAAPRAESPE